MKAIVLKDGEAYQKGIRTDDYLESINGVPFTDYCSYLNTISGSDVKRLVFRTPEGTIKEIEW